MIIYGTQYYRPPFPDSQNWKSDLAKIKQSNFNTVKIWAVWSWIERKEGLYYFDDLNTIVAECAGVGLQVVINIIPEGMPYWASRRLADASYVTQDGRRVGMSGAANLPSGGSPGLCPDKQEVQELISKFIKVVVERYAEEEHVIAFDVWNEPHIEPIWDYPDSLFCYCSYSQAKFIEWLKTKYGELERLNRALSRAYCEWEDVLAPVRFGTYADMIDWRLFWIENLSRWLEKRVEAARQVSRGKTIMTHVPFSGYIGGSGNGGLGQHLGDEFILAEKVDKFGLTSFPKWLMQNDFVQHLVNIELVASASALAHKEFWQSELQAGAGKWEAQGSAVATPDEIRLWNWSAAAGGAKGLLYWQWKPEPSGLEAPGFGLTTIDGELSERTEAACECATVFNSVPGFDRAERVPALNGIYVSRSADLCLHAANQGERLYAKSLYGVYRACFDNGVPVRMVHADEFQAGLPQGLQALYAPMAIALSSFELAQLKAFVVGGGTLIAEACPGLFNEKGVLQQSWDWLEELFGVSKQEVDHVETVQIRCGEASFTGKYYRQDFQCVRPDVIIHAHFEDGRPAVFEKKLGRGRAILIGSLPSLGVSLDGDAKSGQYICQWMNKNGYSMIRDIQNEGNILLRMHYFQDQCYITAVNYSSFDQSIKISTVDKWQIDGKGRAGGSAAVMQDDCVEFQIERRNGTIISLTKK
jgi:beta-galactosidase GanA